MGCPFQGKGGLRLLAYLFNSHTFACRRKQEFRSEAPAPLFVRCYALGRRGGASPQRRLLPSHAGENGERVLEDSSCSLSVGFLSCSHLRQAAARQEGTL